MIRNRILLLALFLVTATAAFAETRVGIARGAHERVLDATVADDGSAVIAVADARRQEYSSRLLRVRGGNVIERVTIPAVRVNHVRALAGDRVWIGGGVATESMPYTFRLLRLRNGKSELLWDATKLAFRGSEDSIHISPDGRLWAVVKALVENRREAGVRMYVGSVDSYTPLQTFEIRRDGGMAGEGGSVVFLDPTPEAARVAVVAGGSVYVVGPDQNVVLRPRDARVHGVEWQPATGQLWLQTASEWVAYRFADLGASGVSSAKPVARIAAHRGASRMVRTLTPLPDGSVLTSTVDIAEPQPVGARGQQMPLPKRNTKLEVLRTNGDGVRTTALPEWPTFRVSPSGRVVLGLPNGGESDAIVIRHLP